MNNCKLLITDTANMPKNVACGSKWLLGCGDVTGIGSGEVALVYFLLEMLHGPKPSTDHDDRRGHVRQLEGDNTTIIQTMTLTMMMTMTMMIARTNTSTRMRRRMSEDNDDDYDDNNNDDNNDDPPIYTTTN